MTSGGRGSDGRAARREGRPAAIAARPGLHAPSWTRLGAALFLALIALVAISAPVRPGATGEGERPAKPAAASTHAGGFSIMVRGNHLLDGSGRVLTLHGVDISGTQWQCLAGATFASPSDEAAVRAIASWHANAVRIPLNEDCWLGINGVRESAARYRADIAGYLRRLRRHRLYAILDLHWNAPGRTLSHVGEAFAGYFGMADEDHAPAFWHSVASYFRHDRTILFDLFNEPSGISWECWLDGCLSPHGFQTAGMQQMLDEVRRAHANQPVIVSGLEKASVDGTEWLAHHPRDPGQQLVAGAHIYGQASIAGFEDNLGVVAKRFPVVIGEAGEKNCAHNDLDALLPWADLHGVSYLAWDWFTGACSDPSLITSYTGTPTDYGAGYREHLLMSFPPP